MKKQLPTARHLSFAKKADFGNSLNINLLKRRTEHRKSHRKKINSGEQSHIGRIPHNNTQHINRKIHLGPLQHRKTKRKKTGPTKQLLCHGQNQWTNSKNCSRILRKRRRTKQRFSHHMISSRRVNCKICQHRKRKRTQEEREAQTRTATEYIIALITNYHPSTQPSIAPNPYTQEIVIFNRHLTTFLLWKSS